MSRRALLVGIDAYPDAPLAGCVNDATAVRDLLARNEDGSPNFDCRLLTSEVDQVTRTLLKDSIEQLLRDPAQIALLYFSGHGIENNFGGYLVTQDATKYDEGVAMGDVITVINNSPVREAVILLDCCQSGAFGAIPQLGGTSTLLREGICILTASRSSQSALEVQGAGLFTSLLCRALDGGASDVGGTVTVASAYAYIDESLGPWDQRPMFKAHLATLTPLRKCPPAVPEQVLRQLPKWFPQADAELPLDPSFEPTAEPHDEENERVFSCLQQCRAAKLVEPVGEDHMYYAAMNSKGCRLTPLGRHYWRLANEGRL